MTLPTANAIIEPRALYPDRIAVSYIYNFGVHVLRRTLFNELRREEAAQFNTIQAGQKLVARFQTNNLSPAFTAQFGKRHIRSALVVTVSYSPLTEINRRSIFSQNEEPRAQANNPNFIRAPEIRRDNRWVWASVADNLEGMNARLGELIEGAATRLGLDGFTLAAVYLQSVEVAYDIRSNDPDAQVANLRVPFLRACRPFQQREYARAILSEDVEQNSIALSGFIGGGVRLKAYVKSDQRIRLECVFNADCLRTMLPRQGSVPITLLSDWWEFETRFATLADRAAQTFRELLNEADVPAPTRGSIADLTVRVSVAFRDQGRALDVLRLLMRNQRISSCGNRSTLVTLLRHNIIRRRSQGQYELCRCYLPAAEFLRTHPEWLHPFLNGLVP